MQRSPLFEATRYFRPFPSAKEVFDTDVERHACYLLPLATVDLSHVSPELNGIAHFIQPIEPYDGVVGEGARKYFNYLCRENWVGYQYDSGKCRLATDFRFFELAELSALPKLTGKNKKRMECLTQHYDNVRKGYELRKSHFHDHRSLHHAWSRKRKGTYREEDRVALVNALGGPSHAGNWSERGDVPLTRGTFTDPDGEEWSTALPRTEDGRDFLFIGQLSTYHYIHENPDYTSALGCNLMLYFDPVSEVALTTFDWS